MVCQSRQSPKSQIFRDLYWEFLAKHVVAPARCGVLRLRGPLASPMSRFAQDDNSRMDQPQFLQIGVA
jgi:hypothetical protein